LTTLHDQTTAMPLSLFLDVYLLPFYTAFFFILEMTITVMERLMKVAADLLVDEQLILRYCPIVWTVLVIWDRLEMTNACLFVLERVFQVADGISHSISSCRHC